MVQDQSKFDQNWCEMLRGRKTCILGSPGTLQDAILGALERSKMGRRSLGRGPDEIPTLKNGPDPPSGKRPSVSLNQINFVYLTANC